jgi:hypothetical protein
MRPLKILAEAEHGLKMFFYKSRIAASAGSNPPTPSTALESDYARCYRQLIDFTQTNGIRLVLSTFSLAVNAKSDSDVVAFYRAGFPPVQFHIRDNAAHSDLVRQLAAQHPEITFVDTQPHLDGEYEKFIDLMHLTQPGRQQLAENFFAGIRPVLESDLFQTNNQNGSTQSLVRDSKE